jgi:hypothetical protein
MITQHHLKRDPAQSFWKGRITTMERMCMLSFLK